VQTRVFCASLGQSGRLRSELPYLIAKLEQVATLLAKLVQFVVRSGVLLWLYDLRAFLGQSTGLQSSVAQGAPLENHASGSSHCGEDKDDGQEPHKLPSDHRFAVRSNY
jgi:hypothetical protein